jgi:hypothetical protein
VMFSGMDDVDLLSVEYPVVRISAGNWLTLLNESTLPNTVMLLLLLIVMLAVLYTVMFSGSILVGLIGSVVRLTDCSLDKIDCSVGIITSAVTVLASTVTVVASVVIIVVVVVMIVVDVVKTLVFFIAGTVGVDVASSEVRLSGTVISAISGAEVVIVD